MSRNFGSALRKSRESHQISRDTLARKLKISSIYVAHLENENPAAPVSISLFERLKKILNLESGAARLAELHNAKVRRYRSARR